MPGTATEPPPAVPDAPDARGSATPNESQPPPTSPQQPEPRDASPASVGTRAYTPTAHSVAVPADGKDKAFPKPLVLVKKEDKETNLTAWPQDHDSHQ